MYIIQIIKKSPRKESFSYLQKGIELNAVSHSALVLVQVLIYIILKYTLAFKTLTNHIELTALINCSIVL